MTQDDCLFCSIVAGEIGAEVVLDAGEVLAFRDIDPQAPTHVLIIPKAHLASLEEVADSHAELLVALVATVNRVAEREGIAGAFRVVTNIGRSAGQSVDHLHLHVLGGREMRWPPG